MRLYENIGKVRGVKSNNAHINSLALSQSLSPCFVKVAFFNHEMKTRLGESTLIHPFRLFSDLFLITHKHECFSIKEILIGNHARHSTKF